MATSLAATIESAFDFQVVLVEGHNGIYEVSLDGEITYTNSSQCGGGFPSDEHVVGQISRIAGVAPKPSGTLNGQDDHGQGPSCPLPTLNAVGGTAKRLPVVNPATSSGCGCGSTGSTPSTGTGCCDPGGDKAKKGVGGSSECC